jgi:Uma2 family endonuclease
MTALELDQFLPATFTAPGLSEAEFFELCDKLPDAALVEYTGDGTVVVMPPHTPEESSRTMEMVLELDDWAEAQGQGSVCGPNTGFRFADGSLFCPDASWSDSTRWDEARKPGEHFSIFAPDFVIEVRSPDDKLRALREKMETYLANGVQLGWLIDPMERTVTIYRPAQPPQVLDHPASVEGEGPVSGFVLNLDRILTG